jgi:hypothetical protein
MQLPKLLWKPSPNFSRRSARVDLLVLHDTEGSYSGSIAWFEMPRSQVSAHYVIKEDGSEVTQMVEIADKAWACCNFNSRSINYEMAGFAAKGYRSEEWQAVANIFAFHLHYFQIPCRWARGGVGPGFCSHFDLGSAGGGHSDPTTDRNTWEKFVNLVETAYNTGNFPSDWKIGAPSNSSCSLTPQE